ncbi:ATP-binding protein [Maribacter cobaltidurans]|uniref:ATP-binding protein n=1 Tax=Maribacter cobaltidurans TaxID=1178778 RepID=A0ABU7J0M3_9FLAO|nr:MULTISPECIES: ATP-binding protein [Maribacter]MEE1978363.1 ATP-binding protein [Maribacter cobaltidurans]
MLNDAVLHIGNIESVRGRVVEVRVNKSKNSSHLLYDGQIVKGISVGSYVKILKGFEELIGKVDEEFITEDKLVSQKDYKQEKARIKRILRLSLIGYFENRVFKQGVKELPLIENEAFLLTAEEFSRVHNFIKTINGKPDERLQIGVLSNETGTPIGVGVNSLFASHIGIFGNTGSGKSYTLASLYHKLFKCYGCKLGFKRNTKFLLIDFNGEYSKGNAITGHKKVFTLNTRLELHKIKPEDKLPLGKEVLFNVEFLSILADATEKTQKPFLKRTVELFNKVHKKGDSVGYFRGILKNQVESLLLMSDKEKSYQIIDYFEQVIDNEGTVELKRKFFEDLDWQNTNHHFYKRKINPTRQLSVAQIRETNIFKEAENYHFPTNDIDIIIHFLYVQLINDLIINKAKNDHIIPAINKLKSKTKDLQKVINFDSEDSLFNDSNFVVLDLNNSNLIIKKTIPMLIASVEYLHQKERYGNSQKSFFNLIIDEAHNILSYTSNRESETWKDYRLETFEEIIKEGRKFGVFLTIASQRPSDISDTIISQLHNYFLHRLINNRDIQAVERTISYLDKVSFDALPILPTGSCVLAGLSAQVPVIINIEEIPKKYEPYNKTIRPTDFWVEDDEDLDADTMPNEETAFSTNEESDDEDDLPF